MNSNLVSSFMKIGPLAQKLQRKFEILNLAGILASGGDLGSDVSPWPWPVLKDKS